MAGFWSMPADVDQAYKIPCTLNITSLLWFDVNFQEIFIFSLVVLRRKITERSAPISIPKIVDAPMP